MKRKTNKINNIIKTIIFRQNYTRYRSPVKIILDNE